MTPLQQSRWPVMHLIVRETDQVLLSVGGATNSRGGCMQTRKSVFIVVLQHFIPYGWFRHICGSIVSFEVMMTSFM